MFVQKFMCQNMCPYSYANVAYWPPTRPGCQNRKCTCVNNRCIRLRNIRIITLTVDRLNECEIVTPTRRRWTVNYYITQWRQEVRQLESDELGIRCGRENQPQRGWALRPPVEQPTERERNAVMANTVRVNK